MPIPPVHPINIQEILVAIFNKHNCLSSVELHKTGHEMNKVKGFPGVGTPI